MAVLDNLIELLGAATTELVDNVWKDAPEHKGLSELVLHWYGRQPDGRVRDVDLTIDVAVLGGGRDAFHVARLRAVCRHAPVELVHTQHWAPRPLPRTAIAEDLIGRTVGRALGRALASIPATVAVAIIVADEGVVLYADGDLTMALLDVLAIAVATAAAWDVPLTRLLHDLPDARPIDDPELVPAVALAPHDVIVGLHDGRLAVRLPGAGTLRYAPSPVRDAAGIRAAIDALRTPAPASGIYR